MAANSRGSRPVRTLVTLGVLIVALFAAIAGGVQWSNGTTAPKLALDLEGGTQIILTPTTTDASKVTSSTISQAIDIIRQRVDSSGVAEAQITSQGGNNIVVALPGKPSEATLNLVRESAQMRFRPVLMTAAPTPTATATPGSGPTVAPTLSSTPPAAGTDPSDLSWVTPALQAQYDALDCTKPSNLVGGGGDDPKVGLVACAKDGSAKYALGPVEIEGTEITNASSGLKVGSNGVVTNEWVVNMTFNSAGSTQFAKTTARIAKLTAPLNRFAMVLDRLVISAPSVSETIPDGRAEISGSFTRTSAATLANQLNFGALPLTFTVQSEQQVSATLGTEQLQKGLLAGLIGLVLVVGYSLLQYRTLGFVTVASLALAAVISYGVITLLSWTQGYRLSLPGVAGLIVAIGITADSFIVYFERVRDELRDGRTLVGAVDKGWNRARRTILASDAVNFLAATVLYVLAVGGVRGFAFTLGLTTLIDLLIVFTFTHPVMMLLAKTSFFGDGHPASGLDPRRLGVRGARYAGRGRVILGDTDATPVADVPEVSSLRAAVPTRTIAERRKAAAEAAAEAALSAERVDPARVPEGEPAQTTSTERNES
ncbi:MAG TPA: protein translocase subunit SecD [Cellulomonadaceae bacterium]|nr:protein translocase subunit SecD [Cellulomonadaceae bacterium]